ncbi:MAG: hypothetical protein C0392_03560 [Syntrophus sp. (in: bacteria)]|nr:hypothetical protein [Syntrophus sp. (in: bacteria)]
MLGLRYAMYRNVILKWSQWTVMIEKNKLCLENDNIYLRPLDLSDISAEYVSGLNNPAVNRYLVEVRKTHQTVDTVRSFVLLNKDDPFSILFGIFEKNLANKFIGTVRVSGIDYFHYIASVGICLFAKQAWGKGYGSQALRLLTQYCFEVIGLHYFEAGVYLENTKSIRCFEKAGFLEQYRVKNKYRDSMTFEEVVFLGVVNPLFDASILKQP